jgi:hypothetical protein
LNESTRMCVFEKCATEVRYVRGDVVFTWSFG